jgi:hypothetical protein
LDRGENRTGVAWTSPARRAVRPRVPPSAGLRSPAAPVLAVDAEPFTTVEPPDVGAAGGVAGTGTGVVAIGVETVVVVVVGSGGGGSGGGGSGGGGSGGGGNGGGGGRGGGGSGGGGSGRLVVGSVVGSVVGREICCGPEPWPSACAENAPSSATPASGASQATAFRTRTGLEWLGPEDAMRSSRERAVRMENGVATQADTA